MPQQNRGDGRRDRRPRQQQSMGIGPELIERIVQINHVAKVVKGGRRFGFSTMVVVGDGLGKVGAALGKAKEVPESITKGRSGAIKNMKKIKMVNGTIPHQVVGRCGATSVLLRPAVPGTGIIAGKSARAILDAAGIRDVLSKIIGSANAVNVVKATIDGLSRLFLPEDYAEMRGKTVGELFIAKRIRRQGKPEEEAMSERGQAQESPAPSASSGQSRRRDGKPSGQGGYSGRPRTPRPSSSSGGDSRRSTDYASRKPRSDRRPDRPASEGPQASSDSPNDKAGPAAPSGAAS